MNKRGLTDLGYKIFLDRYSVKDITRQSLQSGSTVLVKLDDKTGQKEVGVVEAIEDGKVLVNLYNENAAYAVDIEHVDVPLELDPMDMWKRVAQNIAEQETSSDKFEEWLDKFQWLLEDCKFVPGGRILAAAGTETELTYYNCYVIPSPKDSKDEIFKSVNLMAQLMARGGGVGINISSLRPKYAYAKSTNGRSSGAVSWGELYSYTTGLIEQGGCIVGDSLIATAKGNIPIKDLVGGNPWVYSFDNDAGQVVLKQASWVGKTGIRSKVYKLQTDKGLTLYATPEHLVLCRDGEYRELQDLKPGMRIMPLKRRFDMWGKDITVQRRLGDSSIKEIYESEIPIHRFIYSEVYGVELTSKDIIHHIDENHLNNDPINLELSNPSAHAILHGKLAVERGTFKLVDYVNNLTFEERQRRATEANDAKLARRSNDPEYDVWLTARMSHKFNEDNPMKTREGVINCRKSAALNAAYKLLNTGHQITSAEVWDNLLFNNRAAKGKKHGIGLTMSVPRSRNIAELFGSFDEFMVQVDAGNHRVECVEFSHYADVYDMEIPGTNNFAVVTPGDQSAGGVFIHNSRRGALLLMLDDWHPDLLEYIDVKRDNKRIVNANISVAISDDFMQAVKDDADWKLIFPDTTDPSYDATWDGNISKWIAAEKPIKVWKTLKAREVWDAIINSAWACAEPGLWFKDVVNNFSNSWYYAPLISTNPCGEISLPQYGCCNLGAINLSKFIDECINSDEQYVMNMPQLQQAVRYAVRFLDNVIDATPYAFPEIEQQQKSERRIGLGTMGLAEVLIKLQLRYGSPESIEFIDKLYGFIADEAYNESINIAIEKGSFPKCQTHNLVRGSQFMTGMSDEVRQRVLNYGLRNVTLLTQAPTGTIGTMVNTSTGIEPFYFWEFERKGRLGSHIERVKVYEEWLSEQEHTKNEQTDKFLASHGKELPFVLPDWFVTAQDLTPEEHVKVQAAVQRWVDSSISKTCNVPNDYTVEQVKELYELMYELGCKGGTIYRDGSRSEQVLTVVKPSNSLATVETTLSENKPVYGLQDVPSNELATRSRPATLTGKTYRKNTALGTAYVTVNRNGTDEAFETFVNVGKAGSDIAADAEGLGRLISFILRMPSPMTVQERIENVVAQLGGIGSGRQHGFGKQRVMSLPDAIAQVLAEHISMTGELPKLPEYDVTTGTAELKSFAEIEQPATLYYNGNADICPGCGNASLMRVEGCQKCYGCGHSQC